MNTFLLSRLSFKASFGLPLSKEVAEMPLRSQLVRMVVRNLGCIGPEGLEIALDNIVCIVGRNNVGKSTVLRAYELAQGSRSISDEDCCQFTEGELPEIILDVYIPDGIGNIGDDWKFYVDGKKIVRSRWQWTAVNTKPTRQTWDPNENDGEGGWAENGKAGGLDNVFNSRLPQPLRIDSLQDADKEHEELLKLVTDPVAQDLKKVMNNPESDLVKAINAVVEEALKPVQAYKEQIAETTDSLKTRFKGVFPELDLMIQVGLQPPTIEPVKALLAGSSVRVLDSGIETHLRQQGTGSRRALFWSILQVRNAILRHRDALARAEKEREAVKKALEKEQKKSKQDPDKIKELQEKLDALRDDPDPDDISLPGHILLIDEPENALHPMAIRSAQMHLYELASDPSWQVMLTTHSPYFLNPLEDHTTIVRIERVGKLTTPRTYRAAKPAFSEEDKKNLRALLQLDPSLCEMFFGSYPVIVEGDTEQAAFIAAVLEEQDQLGEQVTLVRARGKALIEPLIRLLAHFGVPFGVLHDTDSPFKSDGSKNGMWTENDKIVKAVKAARESGLEVRHRISIPDFERKFGGDEESKGKPLATYHRMKLDAGLRAQMRSLVAELRKGEQHDPFSKHDLLVVEGSVMAAIEAHVLAWAKANSTKDVRYFGKPDKIPEGTA